VYYYRVRAAGARLDSAYSNTAHAITAGTSAAVSDSLWGNAYTPSENAYSSGSYELGVKFTASTAGTVTGARFFEQSWMYGYAHIGHLWSSNGTLLATATFTNETGYDWQQVSFSNPVAVTANTVYIVSFSTGGGYFGITTNGLSTAVTNGPLQAPANGTAGVGGNGVYGRAGRFPNVSGSGMNFWADVVFSPTAARPASQAGGSLGGGTVARSSAYAVTVAPASASTGSSAAAAETSAPRSAAAVAVGSWPYRRTVSQALTLSNSRRPGGLLSGSYGF
jgi:hypothetical protein